MEETKEARRYWESELKRLQELRDNAEKVQVGLDYATEDRLIAQGVEEADQRRMTGSTSTATGNYTGVG
jgi:hypothetical protein